VLIQRLSPSIVSYSDGGTDIGNYSQFRMRGMDQDRINITLNGVPLNDMVDHGTYFSNFSDFGNSVESVQIQRGAGATQRGLASYAGALSFESINLFGEGSAEAQLTLGSFGTFRTAGELSTGRLENGLGFYGRMTRTETDGYKYNSGSDSYSFFFSGGKIGTYNMIKLTAFSGKTQNGQSYENVPLSIIEMDPRTNYNDLNDIDDFEQNMVHLQYAQFVSDDVTLSANAYYNSAGGVFPYTWAGDQYMYGLENDHYGAFVNLDKDLNNGKLSFGVHGYTFDRVNFEYISPTVTAPYDRDYTDKDEISAYGKYSTDIDALSFNANIELRSIAMKRKGDIDLGNDLNDENDWTFINGGVGANYSLSNGSNAYLSIAHTNREPTRSDIRNGVTESESVLDFELGWKLDKSRIKADINAFAMYFNNEISKIGALEERSYMEIRQNVDQSSRVGVEAILDYQLTDKVYANLNMAWMNSNINEYDNGNSVFTDVQHIFTPNWVISPSIRAEFSDKVAIGINTRYVSDSFTELSNSNDFILPSHFILNGQVDISLSKNVSATFMLNNITDVLYFTEGGPIDLDWDGNVDEMGYRIQPPRHFYFNLKYGF